MTETESDEAFVERIGNTSIKEIGVRDGARLFALATRGAAVRWRPIETSHPEEGQKVLICGQGSAGYFVTDAMYEGGFYLMFDLEREKHIHECTSPTHWQPWPLPPALGEPEHE